MARTFSAAVADEVRPEPGGRYAIAARPDVALTVFDSSRPSSEAAAFYATAHATQCPPENLDADIATVNRRAQEQGLDTFSRAGLTGDARLRLYVATIVDAWVLDQDSSVDERTPVPRT
ncbi:hypothetical protein CLV30_10117 [Haloactinopolyspora alba]|uniref:Uncharacterized protein n=1 Tax=Haloactinopolyspora alba TaxID=648780 RepID=A0A2P8EF21_9ACTN|nr:hypothetical protein [Haloactinopolyspora alba]PSL08050.1 hypothetical protein CLV30_10117 [Haloactinopolyspora alba]